MVASGPVSRFRRCWTLGWLCSARVRAASDRRECGNQRWDHRALLPLSLPLCPSFAFGAVGFPPFGADRASTITETPPFVWISDILHCWWGLERFCVDPSVGKSGG